ncbi:MAG: galactitol-1-phosphate 5-dehydrogenase [Oscillospiraceae bacterium]|jgi:L-iditol 2-dehydrogenase|nr:galactitol-1-phosphate 5-dehydrogenase [Oscillospiraceae bacterium]
MKAAVLCGNGDIRCEDMPKPVRGAGEVLVRVKACGVCGSDVPRVLYNGAHGYPIVLGHEFAGVVEEVGEDVTRVKAGQRVAGAPLLPCMRCEDCSRGDYSLCKHYSFIGSRRQGAFAEYVSLPEMNAVVFDETIPFVQGAMFEPSTVALHGLVLSGTRGGEDVAILGGGTIGQFTAQWARIFGARTVTVFDLEDSRLALARRLGAEYTVNTRGVAFMDEARSLTGGRGFGAVFETAGSPVTMGMAFELAGNRAEVCFIGTPHTPLTFEPRQWELMNRKEFRLTGSWMGYSAPFPGREWGLTARAFADGRLRFDPAMVAAETPLSDAGKAFELFKEPGAVRGRIMFVM